MICERCSLSVRNVGPLVLPHKCVPRINVRANPVAGSIISRMDETEGAGPSWAPSVYGEYYPKSTLVYAAINVRAEAIVRPPLRVMHKRRRDEWEEVETDHPLAILMTKVNQWWTSSDLRRATSTYLDLWGSCFWTLSGFEGTDRGLGRYPTEIWPVRPDQMKIIASSGKYIDRFEYGLNQSKPQILMPDEVVWFRRFNPMNEFAGLSPIAPIRLSVDTALDAQLHNRNVFRNGILSDVLIELEQTAVDDEIRDFRERIRERHSGPANSHQPLILSGVRKTENLGLSAREMEYLGQLRWSLEDVSRVYGVPKPLLSDLERATYANIRSAEQIFWRNTVVPFLMFMQEEINEMLCPQFDRAFGTEHKVEFDLSQIEALADDEGEVSAQERADIAAGILTINEARDRRGMPPVPWGDAFWVSSSLVPIEDMEMEEPVAPAPPPIDDLDDPDADIIDDEELIEETASYKKYHRYQLTESVINAALKAHTRRHTNHSKRFGEAQRRLFRAQERETLIRLRQSEVREIADTVEKQGTGEVLFDPSEWGRLFRDSGTPLMRAALLASAQDQIARFGLGISFNVSDPITQEWLDDRVSLWAGTVNQETARLLAQEIAEAQALGESVPQITERVQKTFRFNNAVRADRIARTEIQSATNKGALDSYRQSNVVEEKIWLSALLATTRDAHREAHRQTVPLDATFTVGGENLMHPGDPNGSAWNTVACACTTAPVVRRPARSYHNGHDLESMQQRIIDGVAPYEA